MASDHPLTIGILAHVDSGKTSLAEAILTETGTISQAGRVDKGNAFLDTDQIERRRGITLYSKIGRFHFSGKDYILVDTPGHADLSMEMERALEVMDIAILVISADDGVVGYSRFLWESLEEYGLPCLIFMNKMDRYLGEKASLIHDLHEKLSPHIIDFSSGPDRVFEEVALTDEALLTAYTGNSSTFIPLLRQAVGERKVFPLIFGSALRAEGIGDLLAVLDGYFPEKIWPEDFRGLVYKTDYDDRQVRLTHMRIMGGGLSTKQMIADEKVHEIRLYSGAEYRVVQEAKAGDLVALAGIRSLRQGDRIGFSQKRETRSQALLTYRIFRTDDGDDHDLLGRLSRLEEELPEIRLKTDSTTDRIYLTITGEVFLQLVEERLAMVGIPVAFDSPGVVYRETICGESTGIGHFEPLKHYAEVRLKLKALDRGQGIVFRSEMSFDRLSSGWHKQIERALTGGRIPGVLTGSPITDMEIVVKDAVGHERHTEAGDFAEASIRALRNGLMQAKGLLLEPYYWFRMEVPFSFSGRLIQDLTRLAVVDLKSEGGAVSCMITGAGPVTGLNEYFKEFAQLTRGKGNLDYRFDGYHPCKDQKARVNAFDYDPLKDPGFSPNSIFCSQGSSFTVDWREVAEYAHTKKESTPVQPEEDRPKPGRQESDFIGEDEIMRIFQETFYANANPEKREAGLYYRRWKKKTAGQSAEVTRTTSARAEGISVRKNSRQLSGPRYLFVDGYNIIHAWTYLESLARQDMAVARSLCIDLFDRYQSLMQERITLVFDAYKSDQSRESVEEHGDLTVVYTKKAETADQYIQKKVAELAGDFLVRVASSDLAEQELVRGSGGLAVSADVLYAEMTDAFDRVRRKIQSDHHAPLQRGIDFKQALNAESSERKDDDENR